MSAGDNIDRNGDVAFGTPANDQPRLAQRDRIATSAWEQLTKQAARVTGRRNRSLWAWCRTGDIFFCSDSLGRPSICWRRVARDERKRRHCEHLVREEPLLHTRRAVDARPISAAEIVHK